LCRASFFARSAELRFIPSGRSAVLPVPSDQIAHFATRVGIGEGDALKNGASSSNRPGAESAPKLLALSALVKEHVEDGGVSRSRENQGVRIMIRYVLAAGLVVGLTLPAFAAEYFIVRGPDKQCRVVEKRPTEKTIVVVGDRAYVTKEEATKQVAVVCKER